MPPGSLVMMVIKHIGMPQGSNKFYAKDKLAVAKRAMTILDPKKVYVGDFVADAQRFVQDNNIMPSENAEGDAVVHITGGQSGTFASIYNDGRTEPISQETYVDESIYNLLPDRFKTYKPNG